MCEAVVAKKQSARIDLKKLQEIEAPSTCLNPVR